MVKKAGEPQKKNGKETGSPNKELKEGADNAPNGAPGQVAEAPQAKSDYSFMKEMERHWQEEKNNPYKQPVGISGGLFLCLENHRLCRKEIYSTCLPNTNRLILFLSAGLSP